MTNKELAAAVLRANMPTEAKSELISLIYYYRKEPEQVVRKRMRKEVKVEGSVEGSS